MNSRTGEIVVIDSSTGDDNDDSLEDDEMVEEIKGRVQRRGTRNNPAKDADNRRTSSRRTRYKSSMEEPSGTSISDLLDGQSEFIRDTTPDTPESGKARRRNSSKRKKSPSDSETTTQRKRKANDKSKDKDNTDADADSDANPDTDSSPDVDIDSGRMEEGKERIRKAPSHRKKKVDDDDDKDYIDESDKDDDDTEEELEDDDDDDDDDEEEEQEEMRIQRIIACRTQTHAAWKKTCEGMNTSEVDSGSRWFQEKNESNTDATASDDTFEERFLVKWDQLSFIHCSWETETDLKDQVENAKTYLTTFFRKAQNGVLYTADERCDGDYFDPSFIQIDRILEVSPPEDHRGPYRSTDDPAKDYGVVLDKKSEDFESGTGRQFLVKWCNLSYSEMSYEFEQDLMMAGVEYADHVDDFFRRSTKVSIRRIESGWIEPD